jgi:anthrone oxygenase-like protein
MFLMLQVVTVFLVAVAMSLALAHALELPGKMRLDKATYIAVQAIYYPGFTYGGFGEGLGILATLVLLIMTPTHGPAFWWTFTGFLALVAMHAVYWVITHPVNKFWLKDTHLTGVGGGFFSLDPMKRGTASDDGSEAWKNLRDRWEYSHVLRAALSVIALISLIVAVAI